jgi:hypothetical protein
MELKLLTENIETFFEKGKETFYESSVISTKSDNDYLKFFKTDIIINMNFFTVKVKEILTEDADNLLVESIKCAIVAIIMNNAFKRNMIISELKYDFYIVENPEIIISLERNIPIQMN